MLPSVTATSEINSFGDRTAPSGVFAALRRVHGWSRVSSILRFSSGIVPEAIFAGKKLLLLAHTHIPSMWDERNIVIEDRDWVRRGDALESGWVLPDTLDFGAPVVAASGAAVEMELWVSNKGTEPLASLRSQVCVMLKRAKGFEPQSNDNKEFGPGTARVRSARRSIAVEWENCGRTWGNPRCPCLHSDPLMPDCKPGDTVRVNGRLWFEEA